MSNPRIIYKTDDGMAVVIPTTQALANHTIEEIAAKDVPAGVKYKIVDAADIPTDRTFRDAWTVAYSDLTDGAGDTHYMYLDDPAHPDYVAPIEGEVSEDDNG